MAEWNKNNLAHTNTFLALRILAQTSKSFAAAGKQEIDDLRFWVVGESAEMRVGKAKSLAAQMHNLFVMVFRSRLENGTNKIRSIKAMANALIDESQTINGLADVADENYDFFDRSSMSARRIGVIVAVAMLGLHPSRPVFAQDPTAPESADTSAAPSDTAAVSEGEGDSPLWTILSLITSGLSKDTAANLTDNAIATVRDALESPETQSKWLDRFLESDHGWQFLKDVNLKFKTFEADGSGEAALGFSYDYQESLQEYELRCAAESCARGLDLTFASSGNVAFDADRNPNSLLETRLSFAYFQSTGGAKRPGDEAFRKFQGLQSEFIAAQTEAEEEAAIRKIEQLVRPALTDQFYWELAGDASLESDQKFSRKQWTYGVHGVFEMKGWSDDSAIAKFNVFDYPFAALRALTGDQSCEGGSKCFVPLGTAWPTVLVGLARVAPEDNDPRALAGDSSDFNRLRLEASFRTPIGRLGDDRLYVSVNYRYYEELDASEVVRNLDIDAFSYYSVVLGGLQGIYVSYTEGKLPLDVTSDRVFELGYQFHL